MAIQKNIWKKWIEKSNVDENNCGICVDNNYTITIENNVLKCPTCNFELPYSIWYSHCLNCGLQEPMFQTKGEVIYLHQATHDREELMDILLNTDTKRCVNAHNSNCHIIGEINRFGVTKAFCCPCYNQTKHKKAHNPNFTYCKWCGLPALKKK